MADKKNVIITGGSKGLGYKLAEAFIKDGHNLLICARDEKNLIQAYVKLKKKCVKNQKIIFKCCDISAHLDVVNLFKFASEEFQGKLDVLINNAAILGNIGNFYTTHLNGWRNVFETNLFGTVHVTKEAIPLLKKSRCAHIINIGSSQPYTPDPKFSQYAASKSALFSLTLSLSENLKSKKIAVNFVMPGGMSTSMNEEKIRAGSRILGKKIYDTLLKRKLSGGVNITKTTKFILNLCQINNKIINGKILSAQHDNLDLILKRPNKEIKNLYLLKRIQ